ncbi:MAG: YebC/PmpR family DNA-binding transcriptional regulator [Chloroflexi bacterium]|nr:YebC/PmpR family DNA-binding transcriptional regulator [Chloroflexota bacterium]
MSGHSKWSQIKRQKGVADAKRGQLFTKLAREIMIAVRQGGPDPSANFRLRLAVQKAKDSNLPTENIERAIKKGSGEAGTTQLEEIIYEGYGPGGIAVLVEALTDNRNRTVSDIRHNFERAGGRMGEAGSVSWVFESRGVLAIPTTPKQAEEWALLAIDAGAEDVQVQDNTLEVYTRPDALEKVRRALEQQDLTVSSAELSRVPKTTVPLDAETALKALKLLDRLEELDDVQRVHTNAEFPDAVLEGLQAAS